MGLGLYNPCYLRTNKYFHSKGTEVTALQPPKNRQEFLSMQQQAAAAARDMQRRATLPMPPRQMQAPPRFRQPEPLHHKSPSQQARQVASYGRMQPQMRRQEWQAPPQTAKRPQPQSQPRETYHRREPPQYSGQPHYQSDPRFREPSPPPPPPPAASAMPPLAELLGMLDGLGSLGGAAHPKQESPESEFGAFESTEAGQGSMDSIMILLLLFLLQKENADQGLLLALMYIMM